MQAGPSDSNSVHVGVLAHAAFAVELFACGIFPHYPIPPCWTRSGMHLPESLVSAVPKSWSNLPPVTPTPSIL